MKFGFDLPSSFGDDLGKWCTTDGQRTPKHGYSISSLCEPDGSGELKRQQFSSLTGKILRKTQNITEIYIKRQEDQWSCKLGPVNAHLTSRPAIS